ncbi:MAG: type II toxin-antitoxin system HicA family toxin [Campylobacter sp.]|nr:type II toxin-antitoxin system HicA family toxin [Campylobacter sp.]
MSTKEKLLKNIKNNPKNVSYDDIKKLLNLYGFELVSIKGSHHKFRRNGKSIMVPYHKPIKENYVKDVLKEISEKGDK